MPILRSPDQWFVGISFFFHLFSCIYRYAINAFPFILSLSWDFGTLRGAQKSSGDFSEPGWRGCCCEHIEYKRGGDGAIE